MDGRKKIMKTKHNQQKYYQHNNNLFFSSINPIFFFASIRLCLKEKKKLLTKLQSLFNGIYKIEDNGYLIHPTFQTLPLRSGTDYYKVVQNPFHFTLWAEN